MEQRTHLRRAGTAEIYAVAQGKPESQIFQPHCERSLTWLDNANDQQECPVYRFHPLSIEATKRFADLRAWQR